MKMFCLNFVCLKTDWLANEGYEWTVTVVVPKML